MNLPPPVNLTWIVLNRTRLSGLWHPSIWLSVDFGPSVSVVASIHWAGVAFQLHALVGFDLEVLWC